MKTADQFDEMAKALERLGATLGGVSRQSVVTYSTWGSTVDFDQDRNAAGLPPGSPALPWSEFNHRAGEFCVLRAFRRGVATKLERARDRTRRVNSTKERLRRISIDSRARRALFAAIEGWTTIQGERFAAPWRESKPGIAARLFEG